MFWICFVHAHCCWSYFIQLMATYLKQPCVILGSLSSVFDLNHDNNVDFNDTGLAKHDQCKKTEASSPSLQLQIQEYANRPVPLCIHYCYHGCCCCCYFCCNPYSPKVKKKACEFKDWLMEIIINIFYATWHTNRIVNARMAMAMRAWKVTGLEGKWRKESCRLIPTICCSSGYTHHHQVSSPPPPSHSPFSYLFSTHQHWKT